MSSLQELEDPSQAPLEAPFQAPSGEKIVLLKLLNLQKFKWSIFDSFKVGIKSLCWVLQKRKYPNASCSPLLNASNYSVSLPLLLRFRDWRVCTIS